MDSIGIFSEFLAGLRYEDLPEDVVENTKKFIMDTIGVGIAGQHAPGCPELLAVAKQWGGTPEATVLMQRFRCPAPWAGLVNSVSMHALDFDDTLDESAHHGMVSAFPAALAVAEAKGAVSGKDLICAVTAGLDVSCRIAMSVKRPLSWTRAATCGYFGAVAAAGKILGLDTEKMWNAFGIVYSQTAGNVQGLRDGAVSKRMQPGFAVKSAILSVVLAQKGVTGAQNVLEGDYGFFKLYEGNEFDRSVLLQDLGKTFMGTRLSLKAYPSCRMTHAGIDLALALKREHSLGMSDIETVRITCSKMVYDLVGKPFEIRSNPQIDAQFSLPYTVTAAFARGDVFIEDFEENRIRKPEILDHVGKVQVILDPGIDPKDMMQCRMEVKCRDGRVFTASTSAASGNPLNPLSVDACVQKFVKCVRYAMPEASDEWMARVLYTIRRMETLENIQQLTGLLSGHAG